MAVLELSDIYGAVEAYLEKNRCKSDRGHWRHYYLGGSLCCGKPDKGACPDQLVLRSSSKSAIRLVMGVFHGQELDKIWVDC